MIILARRASLQNFPASSRLRPPSGTDVQAIADERELELHINTGLAGLTGTEIVESVIHLIPYTGFPRALDAL